MIIRAGRVARGLFLANAGLTLASTAGQAARYFRGFNYALGLIPALDLNREWNIPSWYSSGLLLLSAILLALIAAEAWQARRPDAAHWSGLAIVLSLLSIDEAVAIHEAWSVPLRQLLGVTGGPLYYAWVIPAMMSVLLVALLYWRFFSALPKATKRRFLLAAALYVGGAVGIELFEGCYISRMGTNETFTYALMVSAEELLEMCGVVVLIHGLLCYLGGRLGGTVRIVEGTQD